MKVRMGQVKPIHFSEDDHQMSVHYSNRGDPFRQGVEFVFERLDGTSAEVYVLLDRDEVTLLRDKLNEFLGAKD